MNGMGANLPSAYSFDGKSGISPSGPSITGANGNSSCASPPAVAYACMRVSMFAFLKQSNVALGSTPAQSGTAAMKFCHSCSRRVLGRTGSVFAVPDWKI